MAQGRIQYEITAKDRSAAALKSVRGNLGQVQGAVGRLTKLLAPLAAAFSVGAIGSNLVRTNREFQSLKASLTTFTGSVENADRAFNTIRRFAADTPFAVSDVVGSFNILIARGIKPTVAQLSAFGDIAAGSGKSFNQLAEAVADAAVGEFERLKEFGIKARKENEKITFSIGNTTKTVTNDADAITNALTEIAGIQFGGATARQAATLNGAFSNLGDATDNLLFSIGEAGLNAEIVRVTRNITEATGDSETLARTISGVLVDGIRLLERAFGFVIDNIKIITAGFGVLFGAKLIRNIARTVSAVVSFTKAFAKAAITIRVVSTAVSLLRSKVGLAALAIGTAAGSLAKFTDILDNVENPLADTIDLTGLLDDLLGALGITSNDTSGEINRLADDTEELGFQYDGTSKATKGFTDEQRDLLKKLKELGPETGSLTNDVKLLDNGVVSAASAFETNSEAVQALARDYVGLKSPTADARKEQERIEEAIKAVTAAGGDNAETLRLLRNRQIDLRAQTEKTFGAGAIKGVKDFYNSISDNAKNAADFVGSAFKSLEDDLSEFFQTGKLDFNSFKNSIIKGLADIAAKAVISTGINFLGEVFPTLNFADGGLVQNFADGGSVSGPGGPRDDSILARLSDGEFVMNANAVNTFGPDFFEALNTGQRPGRASIDEGIFEGVPGFFLGGVIDSIGDALGSAADAVKSAVDSVVDAVGDIISGIGDTIRGLVEGILDGDITAIASAALPFVLPGLGSGISAALGQFGAAGFGGTVANIGSAVSQSFASGVFGAGSTTAIAKSVATKIATDSFTDNLADKVSTQLVGGFSSITGATTSFNESRADSFAKLVNGASPFLDKRAMGGPVGAGQASMVGENGPEVFVPNRNGTVAPISRRGSDLVSSVDEMKDEIVALRRQLSRAIAGGELAGARG
jgi:hypothetical protein